MVARGNESSLHAITLQTGVGRVFFESKYLRPHGRFSTEILTKHDGQSFAHRDPTGSLWDKGPPKGSKLKIEKVWSKNFYLWIFRPKTTIMRYLGPNLKTFILVT